ncbi:MAG TPA: hypothetical protein VGN72_22825 [Tepidisphaeraceae bacterium]|jgi:hypothetical protein|nr:hypothetical protein [Tepidisphaeraceae bacterium]
MPSTDMPPSTLANPLITWPEAARNVLAALDNQFPPLQERRKIARHRYNVSAKLQFGGAEGSEMSIYVRDVNAWAVGFLVPSQVASHAKATLTIETPDGSIMKAKCLIRRAREVAPGWFDAVLEFNVVQHAFAPEALRKVA